MAKKKQPSKDKQRASKVPKKSHVPKRASRQQHKVAPPTLASSGIQIKAPVPKIKLEQLSAIRERLRQAARIDKPLPLTIAHLGRLPITHRQVGPRPLRPRQGRGGPRQPRNPRGPCQQMTQASSPSVQQDQTWNNWGIIDLTTTTKGQLFTPSLFQPTNPYEIASAIQQAESAGETIRALGSGWSFSDAVLPQPSPIPSAEVAQIEILETVGFILPDAWNQFGYAIDTTGFASSLQAFLPGVLLPGVNAGSLFFVEAGIKVSDLNVLLDSQMPRVALATMGGSAGQSLAGAISTGTHGGDFDRAPLADSVRAIYLIGAGGIHHWIEPAASITDPNQINATFPCISVDNCHYDDDLFHAALVSMGCMGVIYALVIDVVPQYALVQVNFWSTWESLNEEEIGGEGLYRLFTGSLIPGVDQFMKQIGWEGNNRFVQIVTNPIQNQDGTHNCYCSIRFEMPLQGLPAGVNIPSGVQPINLSTLTASELQSQAQNAILSQPECGLWQKIAFSKANISGNTTVEVAQSLISFCKSYNYYWAVRAVIDMIFQANFPSSVSNPQVDIGYKVMAGSGVFSNSLQGDIASAEVMLPFFSTQAPDAIAFVNRMLATFNLGIPQNIFPAGYLSLRACGPTAAFLGMEQFGQVGPVSVPPNVTGAVEMSLLLNSDSRGLIPQFENLALFALGNLHWGQSNGLMGSADVQKRFANLNKWKAAQQYFGGATFTNAFMQRCGLVSTGLSAGWIVILQNNAYWYAAGFPQDAVNQIAAMIQAGNTFQTMRFAPDGTWMIIGGGNYRWYGAGFRADLSNAIETGISGGSTLVNVYIAPSGEWLIQWTLQTGARNYSPSTNFPSAIMDQINQNDPGGTGQALISLVFPPAGGWLGIWAGNAYFASNIPNDTFAKLGELVGDGYTLQDVVFSAPDGWMVVLADNAYWANGSFDQGILNQVGVLVNENYSLVDVVIGVPSLP
jgi:hypothetical protein